VRIGILLLGFV